MQGTPALFLGWEDLLEKGKSYPFQYSDLENSMDCIAHGVAKSWTGVSDFHFPHSSVGQESTHNAGYPGLITGSERSTGEGIGSPLEYSWAYLVAQLVKNLPAMRET